MRHIKQKYNQCALASLCQVHEELDYEELSKSYPDTDDYLTSKSWQFATDKWFRTHLPEFAGMVKCHVNGFLLTGLNVPYKGEGLLYIISLTSIAGHALSYKDGLVLDSAKESAQFEIWENTPYARNGWEIMEIVKLKGGK